MWSNLIATIGLTFDIIGAFFVAIEVVKVYRGVLTGESWKTINQPHLGYIEHEKRKRKFMSIGLGFLFIGFSLQIIALWIK